MGWHCGAGQAAAEGSRRVQVGPVSMSSRTLRRVVGASGSRLRRISTLPGHRGDGGRSIGIRG